MDVPTTNTDETEPWYADGLRFRCTQCGNCCTGEPGVVWVDDDELQAIADLTERSLGEVRLLDTRLVGGRTSLREFANGDCVYFDGETRRCTIYEARPKQCRTWPFWRSNVETPEAWERTKRECPGAGTGNLVQLAEIEQRVQVVDV